MKKLICPKCKADLRKIGLIEILDQGYKRSHLVLDEKGKVKEIDWKKENFENNLGYYCPNCDQLITTDVPEWA